ncbi:MAG TPA: trehalose-6-phosphate synthase [Candidatus Bathyarchaeia archaeon]|nr:trehalose-6-phosphate synthase [Candidatus Bathyarchaeia archaeon]
MIWTRDSLKLLVKEKLEDYVFVAVSHREPYVHSNEKGRIVCRRTPGGVVAALDPVMRACGGTWVAYAGGSGDFQVTDPQGLVQVPEGSPNTYTLKRVDLSKEEIGGYYLGYANSALWPLCHATFKRPEFNHKDWEIYQSVNRKFAQEIVDQIGNRKAFIWIQDYHFCLLPKYLREMAGSQIFIAQFWHIPWPNHEIFRICPQGMELLEGLLSNDLLGFNIQYHCNNFFDVVNREIECKVNQERFSVVYGGHETYVRAYPISVDFDEIQEIANAPEQESNKEGLINQFGLAGQKVIFGVDRIDYTKGIPERLLAVDRFFEKYPEFKEKVVFLQMGVVSRIHLTEYKKLNEELNILVEQINWKHSTGKWSPILLVRRQLSFQEVLSFYLLADICLVSSLHDGMNLVAKEFVAAVGLEKGMLVLSQFTGAARELSDAVLINPYDREKFSDGIFQALSMPEPERRERMERMRRVLMENNVYQWAGKIVTEMLDINYKRQGPSQ